MSIKDLVVDTPAGEISVEVLRDIYPGVAVRIGNIVAAIVEWDSDEGIFRIHSYRPVDDEPISVDWK
jgi:hypothetical protein